MEEQKYQYTELQNQFDNQFDEIQRYRLATKNQREQLRCFKNVTDVEMDQEEKVEYLKGCLSKCRGGQGGGLG